MGVEVERLDFVIWLQWVMYDSPVIEQGIVLQIWSLHNTLHRTSDTNASHAPGPNLEPTAA
jgi:hypothetical protein